MADKSSTIITNLNANPPVLNAPYQGGVVRMMEESLTTDTIQADADILRFFRVHSSWVFVAVRMANADLSDAASPDLELGLYLAGTDTALDDDCFIAAQDGSAVVDSGVVYTAAGGASLYSPQETMFELGGSTAGSANSLYDVNVTIDTAATAIAALILVQLWYIDPAS